MPDLAPQFAELGRAAEAIGRWFDARAWWRLAARRGAEPEAAAAALARLEKFDRQRTSDDRALAAVFTPLLPRAGKIDSVAASLHWPTFRDDAESRGLRFTFDNGRSDAGTFLKR